MTKHIEFFTTLHKNGYDLYGKMWINSLVQNVLDKFEHISATIYVQDISDTITDHPKIKLIDFNKAIPEHSNWMKQYLKTPNYYLKYKDATVRFSYKGFVIPHFLKTYNKKGYAIWSDGDVIFYSNDYTDFPNMFFYNNECIACQVETSLHAETGLIIFDLEHDSLKNFIAQYENEYSIQKISRTAYSYDGHVLMRALKTSKIKYYDLNKDYGKHGIQNHPNCTFLHPEIKKKFLHNICLKGKENYNDWNTIKEKDPIFRQLLQSGDCITNDQINTIIQLRNLRKKQ